MNLASFFGATFYAHPSKNLRLNFGPDNLRVFLKNNLSYNTEKFVEIIRDEVQILAKI